MLLLYLIVQDYLFSCELNFLPDFLPNKLQIVKASLPHLLSDRDSLRPDASPISELMNMAYAQHEITDEYLIEVSILELPSVFHGKITLHFF